jgi:hypothetical protein
MGVQICFVALFAKAFSYSERFDIHPHSLERWLKRFRRPSTRECSGAGPPVGTIFSSFFLSILGISRDVYVGDYQLRRK